MKLLKNKFMNALKGCIQLLCDHSIQIQIGFMVIVILVGMWFGFTTLECALIIGACGLVIVSECVNTVIEQLCDYIQPEFDENIKKIKDGAAGFVLIACLFAIVIGCLVMKGYLC